MFSHAVDRGGLKAPSSPLLPVDHVSCARASADQICWQLVLQRSTTQHQTHYPAIIKGDEPRCLPLFPLRPPGHRVSLFR